jgi:tetratricopeptide (TPR) repeat protein
MGDEQSAIKELRSAVEQARSIGHRRLEGTSLCNLGIAAEAALDTQSALQYFEQGIAVAQTIGDRRLEGQTCGYLGSLLSRDDRHDEARTQLQHAEELLSQPSDPLSLGLVLCQRTMAEEKAGNDTCAREYLERAEAVVTPLGAPLESEVGQAIAIARRRLRRSTTFSP